MSLVKVSPELNSKAGSMPSWNLTGRQLCDAELLLCGGFSPLEGFMSRDDYRSVCQNMRLANGTLWPIPITLDVDESFASNLSTGDSIALRDPEGVIIAVLELSDVWKPDLSEEALLVYGTNDKLHPAVDYLVNHSGPVYLGGRLRGLQSPTHYDCKHLRHTPAELRAQFEKLGWRRVVAFPDQESHAQGTPGTDVQGGERYPGQSAYSPGGWHDKAW